MTIIIPKTPPSKKNSRNCFVKNGRMFNIANKNYLEWSEMASRVLENVKSYSGDIDMIALKFYVHDNRSRDLTNMAESIMDTLVDNGIIMDDSWKVVPRINLMFGGIDKENPRTEILID